MVNLILAGGGGADDSKLLDELLLDLMHTPKLLYIPVAWKSGDYDGCFRWVNSIFNPLGLNSIEMWTNLSGKTYEDVKDFGGVYIGGGNTYKLLHELRKTGLINHLRRFIEDGKPVYGGSAGAIIMGHNIDTAGFGEDSDDNSVDLTDTSGLDLVSGYTVQCHYVSNQDDELHAYVERTGEKVIAIPEDSGIFITSDTLTVRGLASSFVFDRNKKTEFTIGSNILI